MPNKQRNWRPSEGLYQSLRESLPQEFKEFNDQEMLDYVVGEWLSTLSESNRNLSESHSSEGIPKGSPLSVSLSKADVIDIVQDQLQGFSSSLSVSHTNGGVDKLKTAMQSLNDRVNSLATVLDKLHNHVYDKPSSTNKPIENTPKPISEESLVNQWMNKTSSYDPEIHLPPGEDDDSPSMDI